MTSLRVASPPCDVREGRHGGVQPGRAPGGSAALHGAHGPRRLPRQVEPTPGAAAGRGTGTLPGRPAGHGARENRQSLDVQRPGAPVPVLYLLRLQQSVPGLLSSHRPGVSGHPYHGRKLPPHPLEQDSGKPDLLPEAALHPADRQRPESLRPPRPRHSPSLDLESGQQDLLLSDGFLPV